MNLSFYIALFGWSSKASSSKFHWRYISVQKRRHQRYQRWPDHRGARQRTRTVSSATSFSASPQPICATDWRNAPTDETRASLSAASFWRGTKVIRHPESSAVARVVFCGCLRASVCMFSFCVFISLKMCLLLFVCLFVCLFVSVCLPYSQVERRWESDREIDYRPNDWRQANVNRQSVSRIESIIF